MDNATMIDDLAAVDKPLGDIDPADTARILRRIVDAQELAAAPLDVAAFNSSI